jgi:hypothetical protein
VTGSADAVLISPAAAATANSDVRPADKNPVK